MSEPPYTPPPPQDDAPGGQGAGSGYGTPGGPESAGGYGSAGGPGEGAGGYGAAPGGYGSAGGPAGGAGGYGPQAESFFVFHMGAEVGPYPYHQMQQMAVDGQLRSDAQVRRASGGYWFPAREIPGVFSDKEWVIALLLSGLIGTFGVDRFYLGNTGLGVLKLVTCGGFGVWWLVDFILVALRKVPDSDGRPLR